MGTFLTDPDSTLFPDKVATREIPPGLTSANVTRAADLIALRDALYDLRYHVSGFVNVKSYGAKGDGITDDTAALQAAIAAAKAADAGLLIPRGTFLVSQILFNDCAEMHVHSLGAVIKGKTIGSYPYLVKVDRASKEMIFTGGLFIDGSFNVGYTCAVFVAGDHSMFHNMVFRNCALAWKFDDDTSAAGERGVMEVSVTGGHSYGCLRVIEAYGANTVVNFNGFFIVSGPRSVSSDPAWLAADYTAVRLVGAVLYVTGGEIVATEANTANPAVDLRPIATTDPQYQSPYGRVTVFNSPVETPVFAATTNPAAVASTDTAPVIILQGAQGSVAGNSIWITLLNTFPGSVIIKGCSFYAPNGTTRSVATILSNSATANIYLDDSSFGRGFLQGLNAITGGVVHFQGKQILNVRKSTTSIAAAALTNVAYSTSDGNSNSSRFQTAFNTGTGVFTTPAGGLRDVVIEAHAQLATPAASADFGIKINGVVYQWAEYTASNAKHLRVLIPLLNAGDTVVMAMATNTGAAILLDNSDFNRLTIMASLP
jgi:hypothetical protein